MTWRHVMLYWIGAFLLGGWLYVDSRMEGGPARDTADTVPPLVTAPVQGFDEVVVVRGSTELRFGAREGRWTLVQPTDLRVTADLVPALLDTLSSLPPIEKLTRESRHAPQFGLDPPQSRVLLRTSGATVTVVAIGRRNPTRTAVYAAVDDAEDVYLIGLNAQYYLELLFDEIARQRTERED
jgi:hypothetical protein